MQTINMQTLTYSNKEKQILNNIDFEYKIAGLFLGAIVLGLSSPGFNQWYLCWFGMIPFFIILRSLKTLAETIFATTLFGFVYNFITLSYLLSFNNIDNNLFSSVSSFVNNILKISYLSLSHSTVFIIFGAILFLLPTRNGFIPWFKRPFYPIIVIAPFIWVYLNYSPLSIIYLLQNCTTKLALSQYNQLYLIQICNIFGKAAIDFLIILANIGISNLIIQNSNLVKKYSNRVDSLKDNFGSFLDLSIIILIILACFDYGQYHINKTTLSYKNNNPNDKYLNVFVVCNRLAGETKIDFQIKKDLIERYYQLVSNNINATQEIDIFVTPEGFFEIPKGIKLNQKWFSNMCQNNLFFDNQNSYFNISRVTNGYVGSIYNYNLLKKYKFLVNNNANVIFDCNNIVGSANSFYNDQILASLVFDAIENCRTCIIASNSGIIAVIEPSGIISSIKRGNQSNFIFNRVKFLNNKTYFTRTWWL